MLLLVLKDDAFANQSDLDLWIGDDKERSLDLLLYHLSSDYATFGCGTLLEMMNGKNTRTICVDDVPVYQKGKGNSRETDLPKFSMDDTFDICNGGMVYAIDDVLVPSLTTTKSSPSDFVSTLEVFFDDLNITTLAIYEDELAHEGPVILDDGILFTSNRLYEIDPTTESGQFVQISFYNFTSKKTIDLGLSDIIPMANGAVLLDDGNVAILSQGTKTKKGGIAIFNPKSIGSVDDDVEYLTTSWGASESSFNSPNDIIQASDGSIWYTDPQYGYEQGFRPSPESGNWVWRYDYKTNKNRLMADQFIRPNGLAFSSNEDYIYITDSGHFLGDGTSNPTLPSTIYRYRVLWDDEDINSSEPLLTERTVFAVASPVPDGIKIDAAGNVWTGTTIGLEVFSQTGKPVGIIEIAGGVANFAIQEQQNGEKQITIYAMNEYKLIQIDASFSDNI
jgi:gluconolactonase